MTNFVSIISYEPSVPFGVVSLVVLLTVLSYVSMLYAPLVAAALAMPLINSYVLSSSINEYFYHSLLLFIFLEVMLFLAYFWYYFHNISYFSYSSISPLTVTKGVYYVIAGLILSMLSIYLSSSLVVIFIALSFTEFSNALDVLYINDNSFSALQLTIVGLHLIHLLVGIIFILLELSYPHYYHFIEVIWLLIGYCIYLE
jgi:heme/copper-type cytochrome/quinol oxidase subunit 3